MKFKVTRASSYSVDGEEREIDSLEDLAKLQEEGGHDLIVDMKAARIVIYDDYVE